jgi:hypothetical protein
MRTRSWYVGASAVAALVAAPLVVAAHETSSGQTTTQTRATGNPVVWMHENFKTPVAGGCVYGGTLRGSVEPRSTRRLLLFRRTVYDNPHLALRGQVICPGVTHHAWFPTRVVTGARFSRGQLERAVEEGGRVTVAHGGNVCTVEPDFAWRDGRLVARESFPESCRPARGGGPPSSWVKYHGR